MVHDRGRPILTIKYDHICIGTASVSDRIGILPHRSITNYILLSSVNTLQRGVASHARIKRDR